MSSEDQSHLQKHCEELFTVKEDEEEGKSIHFTNIQSALYHMCIETGLEVRSIKEQIVRGRKTLLFPKAKHRMGFRCRGCMKYLPRKKLLVFHAKECAKTEEGVQKYDILCRYCDRLFYTSEDYNSHFQGGFQCSISKEVLESIDEKINNRGDETNPTKVEFNEETKRTEVEFNAYQDFNVTEDETAELFDAYTFNKNDEEAKPKEEIEISTTDLKSILCNVNHIEEKRRRHWEKSVNIKTIPSEMIGPYIGRFTADGLTYVQNSTQLTDPRGRNWHIYSQNRSFKSGQKRVLLRSRMRLIPLEMANLFIYRVPT